MYNIVCQFRHLLAVTGLFLFALPLSGRYVIERDIPYYEAGGHRSGDLSYIDERCKLDLQYPDHIKKFSTVVVFHGGGLIRGGKTFSNTLMKQGFAVAVVNYRLSGKRAKAPDYLYDAAAATAWVMKNIHKYGGSPERVFIAGHSAGGWLCGMIALDPVYLKAFGYSPAQLAGAFLSSAQMTTHDQVVREYRKAGKRLRLPVIDGYAPVSHITKDAPPLIITYGDHATEVPGRIGENMMLHSLLTAAGHPACEMHQFTGFTHATAWWPATVKLRFWIWEVEKNHKDPPVRIKRSR